MNSELLAIQKECRRRRNELEHTVDSQARLAAALDNQPWCKLHVPELAVHYKSNSDEYWRVYMQWFGNISGNAIEREIDDQVTEARFYRFGQLAFLLIETIAAAALSAIFFNAPRFLAIIIGLVISILLGAAASAIITRWVRHGASVQPTKQMHRITHALLAFGLPWLLACVTTLVILRSQTTGLGEILFVLSTTLVTLLSPLCSALCGYAAALLFWSRRLCSNLRWIRALARQVADLLTTSRRSIPQFASPTQGKGHSTLKTVSSAGTAVAVLAALLIGGPASSSAADMPIYIYVDVSPSARSGEAISILKSLAAYLPNYHGPDDLVVSLVPFYEQAYVAASIVQARISGDPAVSCPATASSSEIAKLSRSYAESLTKEAARKCDEFLIQARKQDAVRRMFQITKLMESIAHLSNLRLSGQCTAVNAIISRAARQMPNGIAVVITDGENTCAWYPFPIESERSNRVFVVPVGSHQHAVEESFGIIRSKLARMMPGVEVVEPFRLETIANAILRPESAVLVRR